MLAVVLARTRYAVEGNGASHLQRAHHVLLGQLQPFRDFPDARLHAVFPLVLRGKRAHGRADFAQPAGELDNPRFIAEIVFDFSRHRRGDKGGKLHAHSRIETVDALEQGERSHLPEIVVFHAPPHKLFGEDLGYVEILFRDLVPHRRVARFAVPLK